jgi:hypothetical protein
MKIIVAADILNNKIYVNNLYNLEFTGDIVIEYSNNIIYTSEIVLNKNMTILWFSPYLKMKDISKILVSFKSKNDEIFYSSIPIVYVGTFMRSGDCELYEMCDFIKNNYQNNNNIVEIGSFQGESTTIFSKSFNNAKIFAVDIWSSNYELDMVTGTNNTMDVEDNFDIVTKDYDNIIKIKMSSQDFSNVVNDIDFVYIDGDHSYEGVTNDIIKWKNKIKNGGYIGGHDYVEDRQDLIRAIKENFPNDKINIFGWSWLIKIVR